MKAKGSENKLDGVASNFWQYMKNLGRFSDKKG